MRPGWLVSLLAAGLLAGCGSGPPAATPPPQMLQVCVVAAPGPHKDHDFNQQAAEGAASAGARVRTLSPLTGADFAPDLEACAQGRPALTVAVGAGMASAVWQVAQNHPSLSFALVDAQLVDATGRTANLPNVGSLTFREVGAAYLVGVLAGLMEKEKVGTATHDTAGILGSGQGPAVDPYIAGFVGGARSVDPTIAIRLTYSGTTAPDVCKQVGITQIRAGADILFEVSGACAAGYISAAYDASTYAIGSDFDQASLSPAVITSAVKRVDQAIASAVIEVARGTFKGGLRTFDLNNDGTAYTTPSSIVPQDIINQVEAVRAKIRSGALTPPTTIPPL